MRSSWHLSCAMAVELFLFCGYVSALFTPGNVARSIPSSGDHATSTSSSAVTSSGSIQRSRGFYVGKRNVDARRLFADALELLCACHYPPVGWMFHLSIRTKTAPPTRARVCPGPWYRRYVTSYLVCRYAVVCWRGAAAQPQQLQLTSRITPRTAPYKDCEA